MTILPEMFRERIDGRILKQVDELNFLLHLLGKFSLHLDHQQGVPAQIEEVVMRANVVLLQYLSPDS